MIKPFTMYINDTPPYFLMYPHIQPTISSSIPEKLVLEISREKDAIFVIASK